MFNMRECYKVLDDSNLFATAIYTYISAVQIYGALFNKIYPLDILKRRYVNNNENKIIIIKKN